MRREAQPPGTGFAARLAGLEAAIEGLRHSQNLTIGATAMVGGILAAIIIGLGVDGLQRIDQTQESVAREAAATRQELVGVTTAIANSIAAAREMRPPIVVVPAPAAPSEPHPSSPPGKQTHAPAWIRTALEAVLVRAIDEPPGIRHDATTALEDTTYLFICNGAVPYFDENSFTRYLNWEVVEKMRAPAEIAPRAAAAG